MMVLARKLCLLGDFSVGKTSLVRRYVLDEFSLDYRATVGVQIHQYQDNLESENGIVAFSQVIWDIEGSRSSQELVASYVLGSSGAVIIGDATRRDAVASMTSHARVFLRIVPGRPVVFALNKIDLLPRTQKLEGDELIREFGGELIHTSALTGEAVRSLFHSLGRRMLEVGA